MYKKAFFTKDNETMYQLRPILIGIEFDNDKF